jgi:hypothetical protein
VVASRVHAEGVYYLEWREDGRRLRAAIPNAAEIPERARLKSLEFGARQTGVALDALRPEVHAESLTPARRAEHYAKVTIQPPSNPGAERLLLTGIEAYIRERVDAVLQFRLATAGAVDRESEPVSPAQRERLLSSAAQQAPSHHRKLEFARPAESKGPADSAEAAGTIAESVEAYLNDVEPPQRERETY